MPKPRTATWRIVAERYGCTTCGAAPGKPCITIGRRASYEPHASRSRLAAANQWKDPEGEQPQDQGRR